MSSIRKYVSESNEWAKFSDTSFNIGDLSSARNVQVDYGEKTGDSVNDVLQAHESEIQKLKRNVSWLALHGGGGSGTGSGTSSSKKASCSISVNGSTSIFIEIQEGNPVNVAVSDIKPATDSEANWLITIAMDGDTIYQKRQARPSSGQMAIPIGWSTISKYFEGAKKTSSHVFSVTAKYNNPKTGVESDDIVFDPRLTIPTIAGNVVVGNRINSSVGYGHPENYVQVQCSSTMDGDVKLSSTAVLYDNGAACVISREYETVRKSVPNFAHDYDMLSAFTDQYGNISSGIFDCRLQAMFRKNGGEWMAIDGSSQSKQIFCYREDGSGVYIYFDGVSQDAAKPTEIEDNTKILKFRFRASKEGSAASEDMKYSIYLSKAGSEDIQLVTDRDEKFDKFISYNGIVNQLAEGESYNLNVKIRHSGAERTFQAYIKCKKAEKSWVTYTASARENVLMSLDPSNSIFASSLKNGKYSVVTPCAASRYSQVSATVEFKNVTARSGRYVDQGQNSRPSIRLYDTYMDLQSGFGTDDGEISLSALRQFTVCLCFKAQKYTNSDHVIFSMLNKQDSSSGICVKSNKISVNGADVTIITDKVTTVHIVYNDVVDEDQKHWRPGSFYKIYVDGVLTRMGAGDAAPIDLQKPVTITLNGYDKTSGGITSRAETCNVDVFGFEIFKTTLNELDILGTTLNNQIRTEYTEFGPDFSVIDAITKKNGCRQLATGALSSDIYDDVGSRFTFQNFMSSYINADRQKVDCVPEACAEKTQEMWVQGVSSLNMPVTYIDINKTKTLDSAIHWTFENFLKRHEEAKALKETYKPTVSFYYWDPSTGGMPISSDNVVIATQGTSTMDNRIKNVQLEFGVYSEAEWADKRDLFFVRKDLVPESSYLLKADIVDSAHANNASIGKVINDIFADNAENESFYGFDEKVCRKNMAVTEKTLSALNWDIEPRLKHTVEGFQTLLFVKFYGEKTFRCLGIYSFNIGRNAARNLGFENITGVKKYSLDDSSTGYDLEDIKAPSIHQRVKVLTPDSSTPIYWIENSNSQNYHEVSAWTSATDSILSNDLTNPAYNCTLWHKKQGDDDDKFMNNVLYEVKYHNTSKSNVHPQDMEEFVDFAGDVSQIAVEGLAHSSKNLYEQNQVAGQYVTWKYDNDAVGEKWTKCGSLHNLVAVNEDGTNITNINVEHSIRYYLLALLFGLVDNLDKNMSIRVFSGQNPIIDFYDMDTAFGLNNTGLEIVSPTVGIKQVFNTSQSGINYATETYNSDNAKAQYETKYSQFLPEVYTNKLWMSLDTASMRAVKKFGNVNGYSLYTSNWFKLREILDKLAQSKDRPDGSKYEDFVEYFADEYFNKQIRFGSMVYNYDYTMKYINDYEQVNRFDVEDNQAAFMHGIRKDFVKRWMREHVDFLDSYFYWRGKHKYVEDNTFPPVHVKTNIGKKIMMYRNSPTDKISFTTQYPVIVGTYSTAEDSSSDTMSNNLFQQTGIGSSSADKSMGINQATAIKSISLAAEKTSYFVPDGCKLTSMEEIDLHGCSIRENGFNLGSFYDLSSDSRLNTINLHGTSFVGTAVNIDLDHRQLLDVKRVDIGESHNVHKVELYDDGSDITQHLEYLDVVSSDISYLKVMNQNMLKLPQTDTCPRLETMILKNWTLDGVKGSKEDYYGSIDISGNYVFEQLTLDGVEHVKSISIKNCNALTATQISRLSSMTDLVIQGCDALTSLNVVDCPALTSITVNGCGGLTSMTVLSNCALKNLDVQNMTNMTQLRIGEADVRNVETVNIRNANISGFNYYISGDIYVSPTFDSIIEDPLGNKVLDFRPFESLTRGGVTVLRDYYDDSSVDMAGNFEAIRFPNSKSKPYYTMLDGNQNWDRFPNLKNMYGHVLVGKETCYWSMNYPDNGFFLDCAVSGYSGMPKFLEGLTGYGIASNVSTVFDVLESRGFDVSPHLSTNTLSDLSSAGFISSGFIKSDDIDEFDSREWATNVSMDQDRGMSYAFYGYDIGAVKWQYMLYRYAMALIDKQIAGDEVKLVGFGERQEGYPYLSYYQIPENTLKYFGRTLHDIYYNFCGKYRVTRGMIKYAENASRYVSLGERDKIDCDALNALSASLRKLGSDDAYDETYSGHDNDNCVEVGEDRDHGLFEGLTALTSISRFSPIGSFSLSGYSLPASVQRIDKSFVNQSAEDVFDVKSTLGRCSGLASVKNSFGAAHMMYRPDAFSFARGSLTSIVMNDQCAVDFVRDEVTVEAFAAGGLSVGSDFSQSDFDRVVGSAISANPNLVEAQRVFAGARIPYRNGGSLSVALPRRVFAGNQQLTSLAYAFADSKFKYGLVPEMFGNNRRLKTVKGMFANKTPSQYGIVSDIPARMFWTGDASDVTSSYVGTDRFASGADVQPFGDFLTKFKNTYYPTGGVGTSSYQFGQLSAELSASGILVPAAYSAVTALAGFDSSFAALSDLAGLRDTYSAHCPLAYVDSSGEVKYSQTPAGRKLVKTLSAVYQKLSAEDTWKTGFCGLSSALHSFNGFNRSIENVNDCFACNPNIKPYSGTATTERNPWYNPFRCNYNAETKSFVTNARRNTFLSDDSYTHNGNIWKKTESGYEIDTSLFEASNYNVVDTNMSVITSCEGETQEYKVDAAEGSRTGIILKNGFNVVVANRQHWIGGSEWKTNAWPDYLMTRAQQAQFQYICAPDLLRYCRPDVTMVEGLFSGCDMFCKANTTYVEINDDPDNNVYRFNVGICGRIPPNLLWALPKLQAANKLFFGCSHITGYLASGKTYVVPVGFFSRTPEIIDAVETFAGMFINYDADLASPFASLAADGKYMNIGGMFANCIWRRSGRIFDCFNGIKFTNVDRVFRSEYGISSKESPLGEGSTAYGYGALIGAAPTFEVFRSKDQLPEKVSGTYYRNNGKVVVDDWAYPTINTEEPVSPALPA